MFKAPHDNPYLLFVHSTLTYPINPTPSAVPICQRHPNILPTSSLSARAGQHFLCAVAVLSCLVGGFRFLPVSPPSTAPTPGLCSVIPSKQAELHCHTPHTSGCARPQPFLLPDFSLHLFTTPTSNWAGEQTENSWHSVIKKFECFKMSQNCCPHVLEQKYQLPRLTQRLPSPAASLPLAPQTEHQCPWKARTTESCFYWLSAAT